jgi:hypothetical protein
MWLYRWLVLMEDKEAKGFTTKDYGNLHQPQQQKVDKSKGQQQQQQQQPWQPQKQDEHIGCEEGNQQNQQRASMYAVMFPVFDPVISPRNVVLVAIRRLQGEACMESNVCRGAVRIKEQEECYGRRATCM